MYLFRWMAKKPNIAMCIHFAISAQTRSQWKQIYLFSFSYIYEKKLLACWLVAITPVVSSSSSSTSSPSQASSTSSSNFSKSYSHSSQFEGKWWGIRTLCLFWWSFTGPTIPFKRCPKKFNPEKWYCGATICEAAPNVKCYFPKLRPYCFFVVVFGHNDFPLGGGPHSNKGKIR